MVPPDPSHSDPHAVKGLPPVKPPSGKFMAQLFLVPLAIVGGIALVFFAIIWLFGDVLGGLGGPRTPAQYLEKLDKSNPDVRWRAAADLAQVLLRDEHLASNPTFALDLAERLRKGMDSAAGSEKAVAERLRKHPHLVERFSKLAQGERENGEDSSDEWKDLKAEWKKLEPDLNYVLYLSAALGNFSLPAGAPMLNELALKEPADVNVVVTLQRRRAAWALANLGENLKRFDRLPPERQEAVLAELQEDNARSTGTRSQWAQNLHDYLTKRRAGVKQALGVDLALERCAADTQDPFLRELTGFALGFWEGTPEENRRMDEALLRLTSDSGQGDETLARLFQFPNDPKKDSTPVTRSPGQRIHYNAAVALARRGSDSDYLGLLAEMLNEEEQLQTHFLQRPNGEKDPDEATATLTVLSALKAVGELNEKRPSKLADNTSIRDAVDKLTGSKKAVVRNEAERVRLELTLTRSR